MRRPRRSRPATDRSSGCRRSTCTITPVGLRRLQAHSSWRSTVDLPVPDAPPMNTWSPTGRCSTAGRRSSAAIPTSRPSSKPPTPHASASGSTYAGQHLDGRRARTVGSSRQTGERLGVEHDLRSEARLDDAQPARDRRRRRRSQSGGACDRRVAVQDPSLTGRRGKHRRRTSVGGRARDEAERRALLHHPIESRGRLRSIDRRQCAAHRLESVDDAARSRVCVHRRPRDGRVRRSGVAATGRSVPPR